MQVSVPRSSLCTVVTVRCGHCTAILSVNMMMMTTSLVPFQFLASLDHHHHQWRQEGEEDQQEGDDSNNNPKPWEKNTPSLEEEDNNDDSPVTQTAVTKRILLRRDNEPPQLTTASSRYVRIRWLVVLCMVTYFKPTGQGVDAILWGFRPSGKPLKHTFDFIALEDLTDEKEPSEIFGSAHPIDSLLLHLVDEENAQGGCQDSLRRVGGTAGRGKARTQGTPYQSPPTKLWDSEKVLGVDDAYGGVSLRQSTLQLDEFNELYELLRRLENDDSYGISATLPETSTLAAAEASVELMMHMEEGAQWGK
nr:axial regulator YABBY 4 isoform X1 [Ipomoea batatas]